jgi:IS30 family transposase
MNTIKKQIETLHKSGMTFNEIADAVGYSTSYVYNIYGDHCDAGRGFRKAFREKYAVITTDSIRQSRELRKENKQLIRMITELEAKLESINAILNR